MKIKLFLLLIMVGSLLVSCQSSSSQVLKNLITDEPYFFDEKETSVDNSNLASKKDPEPTKENEVSTKERSTKDTEFNNKIEPIEKNEELTDNSKSNQKNEPTKNTEQSTENSKSTPKNEPTKDANTTPNNENEYSASSYQDVIVSKYKNASPKQWGEFVSGVITRIDTDEKVIALTFDACGSVTGMGFDKDIVDFLVEENIPATLFINSRWIKNNMDIFLQLAKNPLFEIANHGTEHKPLSVNGKSVYGIDGTKNIREVITEVQTNHDLIKDLTGKAPKYFRAGTAYYDEIAVKIVYELGEKPVNYNVLGDAGATFSADKIYKQALKSKNGSIILYHMNHPEKEVAEGVIPAINELRKRGFEFVKLADYDHFLK